MKIDAQPYWLSKLPSLALNSLTLNDKRIEEGSKEIIINPAYENISDDEMKGMVADILSKCSLTLRLQQVEDENVAKFGPRSLAKKWVDRKSSLQDYYNHKEFDPGEFFDNYSGRLRPKAITTVAEDLIKASSAGLPYMQRKGIVLQDALKNYAKEQDVYPCVLFTRTQEQGKTRNVWGYPISETLFEQRFFIPVLSAERSWPHRAALVGPDAVDAAVTHLLMRKSEKQNIFCVDFSSFDASISPEYAYSAFRELSNLFQKQYHPEFYRLYKKFTSIGIYTPDGQYNGPHGVPSGSSFTNTVDSMVQLLTAMGGEDFNLMENCQIQGDDGLYLLDRNDLDVLKARFKSAGLVLNEEKSDIFEDREAIYLQRYYHPNYKGKQGYLGGVYSLNRAINRIKYLERWTNLSNELKGADFFSLRTIVILENCKYHPGFEDIVRLAHRLDRRNLDFTGQGLRAFSKSMESKARAGVFNQYGLERGLKGFETVKILNKL
jgi:hypothetical protein